MDGPNATPANCATCLAMRHNGMTVETAHTAGIVVGLALASHLQSADIGLTRIDELAEQVGRQHLCDEHWKDLRESCRFASMAARMAHT